VAQRALSPPDPKVGSLPGGSKTRPEPDLVGKTPSPTRSQAEAVSIDARVSAPTRAIGRSDPGRGALGDDLAAVSPDPVSGYPIGRPTRPISLNEILAGAR
jgi:hypothetical protein